MMSTAVAAKSETRTRPGAETKARAEPRTKRGAATLPTRILVAGGSARRVRSIRRSLSRVRATCVEAGWEEAVDLLDPGFAAMVIAEPLPVGLSAAVAAVRGQPAGRRVALYALADGDASPRKARGAYLAGANAVIEWPRERELFAGILAETMGMAVVRGHTGRPDLALSRTVRAHLRLGPSPGSKIRLSAENGVVTAGGEARSLAELRRIVETIAAVPGVQRVLTSDLRVAPSGLPDATVRRNVEAVIRATSDSDADALAVAVHGGRVELRGTVRSRAGFLDLLDLIANVKGVRDLGWQIALPEGSGPSDAAATRRLRQAIATLYPDEMIEVSVFGGVAVLTGRVRSLTVRRAVVRLVDRGDSVSRVVDKLVVSGRRR